MRRLILAGLVLFAASTAVAGNNPNVRGYISLDQTGAGEQIFSYYPAPHETFRAYVCFTEIEGGVTWVTFRLTDVMSDYPGVFASPSFTNLMPGNLSFGSWDEGIILGSSECLMEETICVGYLELLYLGGEGCIALLDHPEWPRWVVDCQDPGQVDFHETRGHGRIGGACCPWADWEYTVRCEPQAPYNPSHPPTYWYRARGPGMWTGFFRVQVFDPDPENYTNWVTPTDWECGLEELPDGTWAVWHGTPGPFSQFTFGFDNPNPAAWGHWKLGNSMFSQEFSEYPDGCGYRVRGRQ
jgi:hypothetical protein